MKAVQIGCEIDNFQLSRKNEPCPSICGQTYTGEYIQWMNNDIYHPIGHQSTAVVAGGSFVHLDH